jgi:tetratricopeptide (TPR) repeat protein
MPKLFRTLVCVAALTFAAYPALADDRAHLDAALAAIDDGNVSEALKEAALVTESDPWRADAQFAIAWCHEQNGDHDKAVAAYREVVQIRPTDSRAWNNLGTTLDEMGHLTEAVDAYDHAIAANPSYAAAMNNKGVSLEKMGEGEDAAKMFKKAIELSPEYAAAHNNLGAWYYEIGDKKGAATEWTQAAKLDPTYVSPIVNATALDMDGDKENVAEGKLKLLISTGRGTAEAYFNLAILQFRRGDTENAEKNFEKSDSLRPNDPETQNNLGVIYCYRGSYRRAEQCLRQTVEKKPDWAKAWDNLGLTLFRMERYKDAREAFEKEISIAPEQSSAYYNLGCACASGGDADAAAKAFETSIAKGPKNVEAINNLAVLLSEKKDRDPARELALYKHAVEVDPTFASAHLSLGSFYQSEPKYQDTELAIHHYEEYAKYEKNDKAKVDEVMRTIAALRRTLPKELSAPRTGIRR